MKEKVNKKFIALFAALLMIVQTTVPVFAVELSAGETTTATVEHGADVIFPEAHEHEGYTFTGWDNEGKSITADITITAQYELAAVTGDLNGDDKINTADAVLILKFAAGMITEF